MAGSNAEATAAAMGGGTVAQGMAPTAVRPRAPSLGSEAANTMHAEQSSAAGAHQMLVGGPWKRRPSEATGQAGMAVEGRGEGVPLGPGGLDGVGRTGLAAGHQAEGLSGGEPSSPIMPMDTEEAGAPPGSEDARAAVAARAPAAAVGGHHRDAAGEVVVPAAPGREPRQGEQEVGPEGVAVLAAGSGAQVQRMGPPLVAAAVGDRHGAGRATTEGAGAAAAVGTVEPAPTGSDTAGQQLQGNAESVAEAGQHAASSGGPDLEEGRCWCRGGVGLEMTLGLEGEMIVYFSTPRVSCFCKCSPWPVL